MKAVFIKIHFIFKMELSAVKMCIPFWGDTLYVYTYIQYVYIYTHTLSIYII